MDEQLIEQIKAFKHSILNEEFKKELDRYRNNALNLIKDSTTADDLYTAKGILISVEKLENIFNTIEAVVANRLSQKA